MPPIELNLTIDKKNHDNYKKDCTMQKVTLKEIFKLEAEKLKTIENAKAKEQLNFKDGKEPKAFFDYVDYKETARLNEVGEALLVDAYENENRATTKRLLIEKDEAFLLTAEVTYYDKEIQFEKYTSQELSTSGRAYYLAKYFKSNKDIDDEEAKDLISWHNELWAQENEVETELVEEVFSRLENNQDVSKHSIGDGFTVKLGDGLIYVSMNKYHLLTKITFQEKKMHENCLSRRAI
jgi:hypothetical protein